MSLYPGLNIKIKVKMLHDNFVPVTRKTKKVNDNYSKNYTECFRADAAVRTFAPSKDKLK